MSEIPENHKHKLELEALRKACLAIARMADIIDGQTNVLVMQQDGTGIELADSMHNMAESIKQVASHAQFLIDQMYPSPLAKPQTQENAQAEADTAPAKAHESDPFAEEKGAIHAATQQPQQVILHGQPAALLGDTKPMPTDMPVNNDGIMSV